MRSRITHFTDTHRPGRNYFIGRRFSRGPAAGRAQGQRLLLNKVGTVAAFDGVTGVYKGDLVSSDVGPIGDSWGIAIGPDSNLYLCDYFRNSVKRYGGTTGVYIHDFIAGGALGVGDVIYSDYGSAAGGLGAPVGLAFLPDGNLYVSSNRGPAEGSIVRYNGATGASLGGSILSGYLSQGIIYGADGKMYYSIYPSGEIRQYDPITQTDISFVHPGQPNQGSARQFAFGPDGNLYVTSQETNSVRRYNGSTGAFIDDFVASTFVPPTGDPNDEFSDYEPGYSFPELGVLPCRWGWRSVRTANYMWEAVPASFVTMAEQEHLLTRLFLPQTISPQMERRLSYCSIPG